MDGTLLLKIVQKLTLVSQLLLSNALIFSKLHSNIDLRTI